MHHGTINFKYCINNRIFFKFYYIKKYSYLFTTKNNKFQVFHSLLKAHAVEARFVVRQALEILTPAMPGRMEDGNVSLI